MWTVASESVEITAALYTFLGVVVATLGLIIAPIIKSRFERTTTPPASNGNGAALLQVARDVARDIGQLDQRANDNDERDDIQDRRLEALERYNEHRDPDWRRR